jgi:hypothetical protein
LTFLLYLGPFPISASPGAIVQYLGNKGRIGGVGEGWERKVKMKLSNVSNSTEEAIPVGKLIS